MNETTNEPEERDDDCDEACDEADEYSWTGRASWRDPRESSDYGR